MKIEHVAIWTNQLEVLKLFYTSFFGAQSNEKYYNPGKQFSSYFLSFDNGCRLELMEMPGISNETGMIQRAGLAHFAIAAAKKEEVDALTEQIRQNGYVVAGEPRWTGDGYYESIVLDPDGNRIEITF
jgi:lactoylglutathione lyase